MKNKKSSLLFIVIIIILLVLVILEGTGVISFKSNTNNDIVPYTSDYKLGTIDAKRLDTSRLDYANDDLKDSDLQEISFSDYASTVDGNIYNVVYVKLSLNGKVKVTFSSTDGKSANSYLSNIENAVQIIGFTVPAQIEEQLCYILLSNGDVYYYRVGDSLNNNYKATKVDSAKDVSRLFVYRHPKNTWEMIAITGNNQLISLRKESV